MKILLTGAGGVVGTDLAIKLRNRNHTVVPVIRCSLTGKYLVSQSDLQSSDLVIHAGQPGHPRTLKKRSEYMSNTNDLFKKASLAHTSLIFISSHSSRVSNPSQYSRDKHSLEKRAIENNFSVLRIGVFLAAANLKQSLIVRCLKFFGSSISEILLENLPSTNSENIVSSIQLIQFHDHKLWDCFTNLSSKLSLEGKEVTFTIGPCLRAVSFVDFNQNKWLLNYVDLLNNLTFSFIDPLLNLLYDYRHHVK